MTRYFLSALCLVATAFSASAQPVTLKDNDVVVLLGDTFMEREGNYGYIESTIIAAHPTLNLKFRNLAWSGNTPNEQARSYFGPPAEGQQRLTTNLEMIKPTVVFCCYGAASAPDGAAGVAGFVDQYGKLIDLILKASPAAITLVSPPPAEVKGGNAELLKVRNQNFAVYSEAIQKLATARGLNYVDIAAPLTKALAATEAPLTFNGLHFSEAGYAKIAPVVAGTLVALPKKVDAIPAKLRAVVQEKNMLFFNRYRPQNEIYLFGSRKHEQGNNGAEIPVFDPLIAEKEKVIATLREQPQS